MLDIGLLRIAYRLSPTAYCLLPTCICLCSCHGPGPGPCPSTRARPSEAPPPGPSAVPHGPAAPCMGRGMGPAPSHGMGMGKCQRMNGWIPWMPIWSEKVVIVDIRACRLHVVARASDGSWWHWGNVNGERVIGMPEKMVFPFDHVQIIDVVIGFDRTTLIIDD